MSQSTPTSPVKLFDRAMSISPESVRRMLGRQQSKIKEEDFLPRKEEIIPPKPMTGERLYRQRYVRWSQQDIANMTRTQRVKRNLSMSPAIIRGRLGLSRSDVQNYVHIQEEKAMASIPQHPIELSKFQQYVQERKKKKILFKGEFLMIKRSVEDHAMEFALKKENEEKNNYPETKPFDYNRVIMKSIPNIPSSHYINASYVDSFYKPKGYIITQSVKSKHACIDFWRMVWEQHSNCIVMLTKVFDFMKVMCIQYFPHTKTIYGDFELETIDCKTYGNFVIRQIRMTNLKFKGEDNCRVVYHYHYTEWELNSFPYVSGLVEFRRRVKQFTDTEDCKGPIVVHCSDGGNRSGIYLAIDANLELAQEENLIDVYGFCKTLANSRQNLINDMDSYIFIYDALLEASLCKDVVAFSIHDLQQRMTTVMTKKDRETLENQYTKEYKLLAQLTPSLRIGECAGGHRLENRMKNRDVMIVPPDYARPYLSTLHGESKDYTYINAAHVDGFTRKNEWVVTEWPKHHTIDSFWALIFDHNCHSVITVSSNVNPKQYPSFIHDKGKHIYGPFVVEVFDYQSTSSYTSHECRIMKRIGVVTFANEQKICVNMYFLDKGCEKNVHTNFVQFS